MTNYQIVEARSALSLEEKVNALIKFGWAPLGSVCVYIENGVQYAQAMVKVKP